MTLNHMDFDAITLLHDAATLMRKLGETAVAQGFDVHFDMTPGQNARIEIDYALPGPSPAAVPPVDLEPIPSGHFLTRAALAEPRPVTMGETVERLVDDDGLVTVYISPSPLSANQSAPSVECAEAPAAKEPAAGAPDPQTEAEPQDLAPLTASPAAPDLNAATGTGADDPPGPAVGAGDPPQPHEASTKPGAGTAVGGSEGQAAGGGASAMKSGPLTEAEDAEIIARTVAARKAGLALRVVIAELAAEMGRSYGTVNGTIYGRLKRQIEKAEATKPIQPAAGRADISPKVAPAADPAAEGGSAAPPPAATPIPAKPDYADPLIGHLVARPMTRGDTPERDFELMDMSCEGFDTAGIAGVLNIHANDVKARFELLTGGRKWKREAVRDALRLLMLPAAAE